VKDESAIRRLLLCVLVLGIIGMLVDLMLLAHYEDALQLIPLVVLAAGLAAVAWHLVQPRSRTVRALQIIMSLFVAAGVTGIGLHFDGASGFQLEIDPSLEWWPLVKKVARSQSPPLLAPAAMVQLGLIGLIYAFSDSRTRARPGAGFEEGIR
jgi:hypothetical protein